MHTSGMFRFIKCRQLLSLPKHPPLARGGEEVTPKGEPHRTPMLRFASSKNEASLFRAVECRPYISAAACSSRGRRPSIKRQATGV